MFEVPGSRFEGETQTKSQSSAVASTLNLVPRTLNLLHDGVEAVGQHALLHGFGVLARGEGADLDVQELVLGLVADTDAVTLFLQRGEQDVGDILAGDGGDLHHDGAGGGSCRLLVAGCWLSN